MGECDVRGAGASGPVGVQAVPQLGGQTDGGGRVRRRRCRQAGAVGQVPERRRGGGGPQAAPRLAPRHGPARSSSPGRESTGNPSSSRRLRLDLQFAEDGAYRFR